MKHKICHEIQKSSSKRRQPWRERIFLIIFPLFKLLIIKTSKSGGERERWGKEFNNNRLWKKNCATVGLFSLENVMRIIKAYSELLLFVVWWYKNQSQPKIKSQFVAFIDRRGAFWKFPCGVKNCKFDWLLDSTLLF